MPSAFISTTQLCGELAPSRIATNCGRSPASTPLPSKSPVPSALTTVTEAQPALTHPEVVFRARAKYVVVPLGVTVGFAPPGTGVPPQLPVNQSTVWPAPAVAESVDVWPGQIRD